MGRLRELLKPMNLAAAITVAAVGLGLRYDLAGSMAPAWTLLGVFLAALLALDLVPHRPLARAALYLLQAGCAFVLIAMAARTGIAPILTVVLIAELAMDYRPRTVLLLAALMDAGVYLVLALSGHARPELQLMLYLGFQAFAALTTYYARSAEQARDRLARVNADLLATRALLADSARDSERLRMARELHDVAGHKLTALTLNLRALAADPRLAGHAELDVAERLAGELLGDLRGVVQALRDERGLDLGTALRALAAPLPRPALRLRIAEDVRVADPDTAETLLRLVQEALTNSARHAGAAQLWVTVAREGAALRIRVEDDGRCPAALREGNGLAGMRERIAAHGGELRLERSPAGALRIEASLPA
ncbi:signal transduction histidine kinase [Vulcaniibacterium tengchongense]|uniref:Signal transduction histidine kinase n=1 Tax=Vulcaniibacterium tengchongense TaxID=1273429 RepID=A0A3N4VF63_9GAMM|nr:histidine kinase [Vulcaniibacterium tengchongense]RPE80145.1 signal transduction histidine kinase [Vulcaniibacterium tengchongense]